MSEELICPCCGEEADLMGVSGFVECTECMFMCDIEQFPRISAAMELAKAEVVLDVSSTRLLEDSSIQDGTVELEDWRISHQQIMKRLMAAKDRVLEVFK